MSKQVVLLDPGHGINTPGKRSPGGIFYEWAWTHSTARDLKEALEAKGHTVYIISPEDNDTSLAERVRRANAYCKKYGAGNCMFISIHVNAAGSDGKWHKATGWQVHVSPKGSAQSKRLADCLSIAADNWGIRVKRPSPRVNYWPGNFQVLNQTSCKAVLVENMFMDNSDDVAFLKSDEGNELLQSVIIEGIENFCK